MENEGEFVDARKEKKSSGKAVIWILVAVIVILAVATGALAYPLVKNKLDKINESTTAVTPTNEQTVGATTTATIDPSRITDAGVTWIAPIKLDDLGLFKKNENFEGMGDISSIDYYKVGTTAKDEYIIDGILAYAPTNFDVFRIIKKSDGYYKVAKNSPLKFIGGSDIVAEVGLKIDTATEFKSLSSDKTITKGQTKLTLNYNGGIKDTNTGTKIDDTKWGSLYKEDGGAVSDSAGTLNLGSYYIKLSDSTRTYYDPAPTFMRDDGTLDISWSDQNKKNLSYKKVATGGCGSGGATSPFVANSSLLSSKEQVASNAKMYFISDKDNALDQYIYKIYKQSAGSSAKSIDSFIENIGMLVWTDDYGDNIVYSNKDYSFEGECGKPVVYLYPTKPTAVSVKVGAKITKSDPLYGNGWTGIANPDGKITVAGKTYPYLFWEGLGLGAYPQIVAGTVVATLQVEATIKSQLAQIGLNQKETADFMEFWMPKMPKTNYVRLTWLQNKEMDALAPLKITPKPDTIIRVFLDFAGLDQKQDMPAQNLKHILRNGFTAVEWGGLLKK